MNLGNFGMDTVTLAGPLEAKLRASKALGFSRGFGGTAVAFSTRSIKSLRAEARSFPPSTVSPTARCTVRRMMPFGC